MNKISTVLKTFLTTETVGIMEMRLFKLSCKRREPMVCTFSSHTNSRAMSALGGSSTLGDGVVMGGKAAVADHVSVAARVRITACSGVTKDIPETAEGTDFAGFPAQPAGQWRRQVAAARRRERR